MKPNYIVIGSMKSGTSTLCHLLGQHPDVFMSNPKEPEYFCNPELYARGLEWYETLFEDATGKSAVGEGSTSYTKAHLFPGVPERIARDLPDVRLIYIVRHPLERIESQWMYNVRTNYVHQSFDHTLRDDKHLINTSRYWWQLNKYREHFDDARILVLFFEEMKQDPGVVLRDCFDFLGVDADAYAGNTSEQKNVTPGFGLESRALSTVGKIPGYRTVKDHLPAGLKKALRPLLKKQVSGHPQWDPELKSRVIQELESDTRELLEYCNKPGDYWNLAG